MNYDIKVWKWFQGNDCWTFEIMTEDISIEYDLNDGMVRRWLRELEAKNGDFWKKKELSTPELEIKVLKKEVSAIKIKRYTLEKIVSIF